MQIITQSEYDNAPSSNKSVWTTERTDLKYWDATRHLYMGKRTLLYKGGLLIEGMGFVIVPDNAPEHAKRPQFDRVRESMLNYLLKNYKRSRLFDRGEDYGNSVVSSHTKRMLADSSLQGLISRHESVTGETRYYHYNVLTQEVEHCDIPACWRDRLNHDRFVPFGIVIDEIKDVSYQALTEDTAEQNMLAHVVESFSHVIRSMVKPYTVLSFGDLASEIKRTYSSTDNDKVASGISLLETLQERYIKYGT